jgi:hypothetical protein
MYQVSEGEHLMSDERNVQPQDELTDDQLADVSGGDGNRPDAHPAPATDDLKKKPIENQANASSSFYDLLISS